MKVALALIFSVFVCLTLADDDCQKSAKDVFDCLKKKFEDSKDSDEKKIEEAKTKVSKCFSDNGCKEPDFEKKGNRPLPGSKIDFTNDNTPKAVKECLKKDTKKKALEKVNECLKEQKVKTISEDEIDQLDIEGDKGSRPEADERVTKCGVAVAAALKRCEKDKDDKTRDKVASCVKPLKEEVVKELCKRIGDCKDSAKVSESCQKRAKEIKEALCKCKEEKMEKAKTNVEKLQQKGDDVDADDMDSVMPHELQNFNFDSVKKCFEDNKEPVPPMIHLMESAKKGGPLGIKPKVSQSQLQTIHDFLDNEIKSHHCGCDS